MKKQILKWTSGYKYQLESDVYIQTTITGFTVNCQFFELNTKGFLKIFKGYAWDGPSGPTVDTKNFMRGSLVHDVIYQMLRQENIPQKFRKNADKLLYVICRQDGMNYFRANTVYFSVRKFAGFAAKPKNKKKLNTFNYQY